MAAGRRVRQGTLLAMAAGLMFAGRLPAAGAGGGDAYAPEVREQGLLEPRPEWPVWLRDAAHSRRTDGTSGIDFIGRDEQARNCFFVADDVGFLYFCRVADPGQGGVTLEPVVTGRSVLDELALNERLDFEALGIAPTHLPTGHPACIDGGYHPRPGRMFPDSVSAILSVDGRGPEYAELTRILSVDLIRRGTKWRLESRGDAMPGAHFWKGDIAADRGIAGLAISARYYFLGLESLHRRGEFNVDGSVFYIYDRQTDRAAMMATRALGIHSICALAAINDTVTVVADRNRQSICVLTWNADVPGRLRACDRFRLHLPGPGGSRYAIASIEGMTVDGAGDIWCATDPWSGNYRVIGEASEQDHVFIAAEMPMLYRFPGDQVWPAAGLEDLWSQE